MTKNIVKFFGGTVLVVVLGLGALFAIDYIRYQKSPEYQVMKEYERMEQAYAEDTYGGSTPEEPLNLFIDALKRGDVDLASKYFVVDKQEEQKKGLQGIWQKGLFINMITDLEKTTLTLRSNTAYFTLVRQNDLPSELVMRKNPLTNVWKITEL